MESLCFRRNKADMTITITDGNYNKSVPLVVPETYDGYTVTAVDYMGLANSDFTSISLPETITKMGGCALECAQLTSFRFPSKLTSIGSGVMWSCMYLESVTLPPLLTEIPQEAFYYCQSLRSVTIPDKVTTIRASAFETCRSLTSVTLPLSVTKIEYRAFDTDCSDVLHVYYAGSEADRAAISIGHTNQALENAVWHYNCK